jgi:hypothetical protein
MYTDVNEILHREILIKVLIAKQLTLEQFTKQAESCGVCVKQPGMIYSCECRGDNSRFSPYVENGIVTGGSFG